MLKRSVLAVFVLVLALIALGVRPALAQRTVFGTITMQGRSNYALPLTFDLCAVDKPFYLTRSVTPAANGTYSLANLPSAQYTLGIKGDKWLRSLVSLDLRTSDAANVNATLLTGDVNNDNTVDISDLNLLIAAYNTHQGDPSYNAAADLNGDNIVDISDLNLLIGNYNQLGGVWTAELRAAGSPSSIILTWKAGFGDTTFGVFFSSQQNGTYTQIATTTTPTYTDTTNGSGWYKVKSLRSASDPESNIAFGTRFTSISSSAVDTAQPAWAEDIIPTDSPATVGMGPSSATSIDVSSGILENRPGVDIVANNPYGTHPAFSRLYRSAQSERNVSSPGLTRGWTHNYDLTVIGDWNSLQLTYPNGAKETWIPSSDLSQLPIVQINPSTPGTPYCVLGQRSATQGLWVNLKIVYKDQSSMVFEPDGSGIYRLTQIVNAANSRLLMSYNGGKLMAIHANFGQSSQNLLSLSYNGTNGTLSQITDVDGGRTVNYVNDTVSGVLELKSVSQVNSSNSQWEYRYTLINGTWPLLVQAGVVDPTNSTAQIVLYPATQYDSSGRITVFYDANGNKRTYTYLGGYTQVQAYRPVPNNPGTYALDISWLQNYDGSGADTGTVDANGYSDQVVYGDSSNPKKPTRYVNRSGQVSDVKYDLYGNVTEVWTPFQRYNPDRVETLLTKYTYDYTASLWPCGKLIKVEEGNETLGLFKTPTTYTYYDGTTADGTKGALHSVISPQPGTRSTVGGTPTIESTIYTYTALGNISTIRTLAPNQTMMPPTYVTVTYTYGTDTVPSNDQVSGPEILGKPLAITVPRNSTPNVTATIHLRYNARGDVIRTYDELGNLTEFQYNDARQVTRVIYPPTISGGGRASVAYTYPRLGGPAQDAIYYDESGAVLRSVRRNSNNEDDFKVATGNIVPSLAKYDSLYRHANTTNGNSVVSQQYAYDAVGNFDGVTYPNATSYRNSNYDPDGRVTERTDSFNRKTNYQLGAGDGRIRSTIYPDPTHNIGIEYDNYARVSKMTDRTGIFQYQYDDLDAVTQETTQYYNAAGTLLPVQTQTYQYFLDGSRSNHTLAWLDTTGRTENFTTTYSYYPDGSEQRVNLPWQFFPVATGVNNTGNINFTYDARGRVMLIRQTRVRTDYAYNSHDFLVGLRNYSALVNPNVTLSEFGSVSNSANYAIYDALGLLRQMPYTQKISNTQDGIGVMTYGYDSFFRLNSETRTLNGPFYNITYTQDAAGNLNVVHGFTFGSNSSDQLSASGYQYDANGNLSQGKVYDNTNGNPTIFTATYDFEDLPTSLTFPNNNVFQQAFRADGQRAWKQFNNGARSYFIYDGDRLVAELDATQRLTLFYGWTSQGLMQRLEQQSNYNPSTGAGRLVRQYAYDMFGHLAHRVRHDDFSLNYYAADSVIYDRYGQLWGDYDFLQGGGSQHPFTLPDAVGAFGQFGEYSELESRPNLTSTPLVLADNGYYDPIAGRPFVRQRGLQNEYEFQLFFYDSMAGFGKGMLNSGWHQLLGLVGGSGKLQMINGISRNAMLGQLGLEHLDTPFRYNNQTQAIFGTAGEGTTDAFGMYMAGASQIRSLGGAQLSLFSDIPSAIKKARRADAETFITYKFEKDGEVVYIGMATGKGTPEEVLAERLRGKRHDYYFKGDKASVLAVQGNEDACKGAEQVWYDYYKHEKAPLRNIRSPLNWTKTSRRAKNRAYIDAYAEDLRN